MARLELVERQAFSIGEVSSYNEVMRIYLYALFIFALVLGAQKIGLSGLYYQHPNFDMVPHFLTGLGIGLFLCALFKSFFPHRDEKIPIVIIVIGIIISMVTQSDR